ncbi:uncharacterized protein V1510DRAFT_415098 [Dipodascopsis tothii]|uniref:uncharacterized protein n=1 Tax=Dipodascopsis tothii TaxID=44089 RepID=UPI0034CFC598
MGGMHDGQNVGYGGGMGNMHGGMRYPNQQSGPPQQRYNNGPVPKGPPMAGRPSGPMHATSVRYNNNGPAPRYNNGPGGRSEQQIRGSGSRGPTPPPGGRDERYGHYREPSPRGAGRERYDKDKDRDVRDGRDPRDRHIKAIQAQITEPAGDDRDRKPAAATPRHTNRPRDRDEKRDDKRDDKRDNARDGRDVRDAKERDAKARDRDRDRRDKDRRDDKKERHERRDKDRDSVGPPTRRDEPRPSRKHERSGSGDKGDDKRRRMVK